MFRDKMTRNVYQNSWAVNDLVFLIMKSCSEEQCLIKQVVIKNIRTRRVRCNKNTSEKITRNVWFWEDLFRNTDAIQQCSWYVKNDTNTSDYYKVNTANFLPFSCPRWYGRYGLISKPIYQNLPFQSYLAISVKDLGNSSNMEQTF